MIAWLKGILLEKSPPALILEVNGVGYELEAPLSTFYDLPDEQSPLSLFVHMVVREDAQLLFGFSDKAQRDLFRNLIKVSGIGPKVALAILSTMNLNDLLVCLHNEDVSQLVRVPGIGKKTAARLLVELKDRLPDAPVRATSNSLATNHKHDAIAALVSLGFKEREANQVINRLESGMSSEELIRQALPILSGNKING